MTRLTRSFLSVLIVGAIASINFLLFESSLKYWVFTFEVALTLSMLFLLRNATKVNFQIVSSLFNAKNIDFVLLFFPLALLFLILLKIYTVLTFILVIITSFFILGYVILRLIGFNALESPIEWLVLSFYLSIPVNCLLYTFSLKLPEDWRATVLSTMYLTLTTLMILKRRTLQPKTSAQNKHLIAFSPVNILAIAIVTVFFLFSIAVTYPQMAYRPSLDITRHYSASLLVNEDPKNYMSPYPWFHIQLATSQLLCKQPMETFQTALALLSIVSILSFYIMAKAYLNDLNDKLPILSTIFWSAFSGFGWLNFLTSKLTNVNSLDHLALLGETGDKSYWDVGYGQGPWVWLWFRPLTLGITGVFALLYLLKRKDISKKAFFTLTYFVVISLGMIHFSELTFWAIFLFASSLLLFATIHIRLEDSLNASSLGLLTILGLLFFYRIFGINIEISTFYIAILAGISASSILILRVRRFILNSFSPTLKIDHTHISYVVSALSVLWLAILFYWLITGGNFHVYMVSSIHAVPWILYPVLLGICGFLTLLGIEQIVRRHLHHSVTIFVVIMFAGVVFGRLVTYINAYYTYTGYWERRFIPLIFSASTVIASISAFHVFKKIQSKMFLSCLLLSLVVVGGVSSTALSIEYQTLVTPKVKATSDELNQVRFLRKLDSDSYLLAFSQRSLDISGYAPFAWRIGSFRYQIWPATSPELALNALFSTGHPTVIYLRNNDYATLSSTYSESYVIHHLIKSISPFFNDEEASIYNQETITPPVESSKVVLVLAENMISEQHLYAYDILSLAGYNYTTSYISDIQTLRQAETIVVPSEISATEVLELKANLELSFNRIITLNLDGYYGELADVNCLHANVSSKASTINAGSNILQLTTEIDVAPLKSNAHVMAYYGDNIAFFAAQSLHDEVNLTYLNFYPIIETIRNGSTVLYEKIGMIARLVLGNLSTYTFQSEPINAGNTAAFRQAILQGNTEINFDSVVIRTEGDEDLSVKIDEQPIHLPENVSVICPTEFENGVLEADYMKIIPSKAFYINAILKNVTLNLNGNSTSLVLILNDGSAYSISGKGISLEAQILSVLLRKPRINVDGKGVFTDLYAYHDLHRRTKALGTDCEIEGSIIFTGKYGDTYTVAKLFDYNGNVKLSKPLYEFDELKALAETLPYFFVIALCYIAFEAMKLRGKRHK